MMNSSTFTGIVSGCVRTGPANDGRALQRRLRVLQDSAKLLARPSSSDMFLGIYLQRVA